MMCSLHRQRWRLLYVVHRFKSMDIRFKKNFKDFLEAKRMVLERTDLTGIAITIGAENLYHRPNFLCLFFTLYC